MIERKEVFSYKKIGNSADITNFTASSSDGSEESRTSHKRRRRKWLNRKQKKQKPTLPSCLASVLRFGSPQHSHPSPLGSRLKSQRRTHSSRSWSAKLCHGFASLREDDWLRYGIALPLLNDTPFFYCLVLGCCVAQDGATLVYVQSPTVKGCANARAFRLFLFSVREMEDRVRLFFLVTCHDLSTIILT